jgi:hypothetical protein
MKSLPFLTIKVKTTRPSSSLYFLFHFSNPEVINGPLPLP